MCDSDDANDQDRGGVDLTGFLFGNIDESGQLEDDGLLDGDSKRMLSSLSRLGLGSMLSEVLENEEKVKEEEEKDYTIKSPSAVDFFDIDDVAEDAQRLILAVDSFSFQNVATVVPVTTRAVGFYTQWLFKTIYERYGRRKVIPECTPYAFYRVTLAQFEYRLLRTKHGQINTISLGDLFYRPQLTLDEQDVIKSMVVTFAPIANLLDGIGCFEFQNNTYYSQCPRDDILGILYSNLRQTVQALANTATPDADRTAFYNLSSLPFAEWDQQSLLLNPDDYMPAGYGIEDFESDVHRVKNLISFVACKEIKMVCPRAKIDYDAPGHHRFFVSNDAEGLRIPDRRFRSQWADEGLPHGDLVSFWSPENISYQDFYMGVINLVGERRSGGGDVFAFRAPQIARQRSPGYRWTALVENMIA